jgi:hypothetical protein
MPSPLPPFDVGAIVPSTRDFLQATRTRRSGLALVPLLATEESAREALRDVESGVPAVAMTEPGPAMAAAAAATKVPMLCLRLVASKDDYLAARAFGADAAIVDPAAAEKDRGDLANGIRSTRMVALELGRDTDTVKRAAGGGARAIVLTGPDVAAVAALAAGVAPSITLVAWPDRATEADARRLVGVVDALVVGVDIYGATGFERLVSELNP